MSTCIQRELPIRLSCTLNPVRVSTGSEKNSRHTFRSVEMRFGGSVVPQYLVGLLPPHGPEYTLT